MTVRDPNDDKYVATTPNSVKKGDQNTAVIGPARLQDEEETQQQIDKGVAQASFTSTVLQGKFKLGKLAPGYWHTSKYLTGNSTNRTTGPGLPSGRLYPIMIGETSTIDAMAIYVADGLGGTDTYKYYMRLGIYNEVDGLPFLLLMETNEFNLGDGSIPDNTFYVEEFGAELTLAPGRYWLARRMKYSSIPSSFGNNPTAHGRAIHKGTLALDGSSIGSTTRYGAIAFTWPDGSTSLPAVFDINDYPVGSPPSVADDSRPEIYLRAV